MWSGRRWGVILACILPALGARPTWAEVAVRQAPPQLSAQAAIVMDPATGTILYEKNAFLQMDPASTTKIMTALLVIEHGHLERSVTISKRADYTPGSSLHIIQQHRYTRLDLLRGMLLRSGNDASVALAESDAGSVERFVAEMNVRAHQLGAFNTSYENTHGLTRSGHYSSAYDLALITQAALQQPLFREIVGSQELTITELSRHRSRSINNTNQLLYGFPGADGVKTGTTDAAGRCVVASATRDHRQLIAVVLKSGSRWMDARRMLNWGFSAWNQVEAVAPRQTLAHHMVIGGRRQVSVGVQTREAVWIDVPTGQSYKTYVSIPKYLRAPLSTGQRIGWITVDVTGQPPVRVGLFPSSHVLAKPNPIHWWQRLNGKHD